MVLGPITEYEGQVKEFFKYLETQHVDGIVVAGGNGTLVETVTGILRKENTTFSRKVPVGVIPVGETNMRMLDAAMAVVKGSTEKLDVLKIEGDGGKTTYALCGLQAGVYRDARGRASKYWYLGPLKHRFTYLRSSFGLWPPVMHGKLEYTEARDTDIPVKKAAEKFIEEKPAQQSRSFVMSILGIFSGHFRSKMQKAEAEEDEVEVEYTNTHTVDTNLESLEITISTGYQTQERKGISLGLAPANISKTHFISEGWRRISEPIWKMDWDTNSQVPCRRVKLEPEVNPEKESWYNIDGEQFEAMPIEVTLLKNKLKFFKCQTQPS
ncbi:AGK-like protein [Mya arenaria]|uniref:Acylglycerol kinase, mitochondrial n=1 Tax=Mya arenaria TaxID=6604 RepID=A0ABY7DWF2_MYAAR|nr:AGK-like protein [Mya arenaria]